MARRKRDYYVVLGLGRNASDAEIKRAFRELARKHHPDVSPDDGGEAFREINEAYAVLSDRESRTRFDRWGHGGDDASSGLGAVVDAAQDMFNEILRRRRGKQKGSDTRYTLEVTFEEAAFGTEKTITIPPPQPGATPRELKIVIPTATKEGTTKIVRGEGEPGKAGAPPGDLNIIIRIAEHATFRRDGLDVHSDYTISFTQAALGAVLDLPTLDGEVKMRIPEGTQPGRVFRIRSRGIPHAPGKNAPRGDHLVHVQVEVPTKLTAKQRELIEELARASGEETGVIAPKKRLLDRVRSLLDE
ncbi:J domain-containing protein [soil metagenome]